MSKVLLTGHKGFVGQRVLAGLGNHNIRTLTESEFDPFRKALDKIIANDFDFVLHLGAVANPQEQTTRLWQMNVAATQLLLEKATFKSSARTKFLFMSSYSVYNPDNDYGWTKRAGEKLVAAYYAPFHKRYCILRPVSIFGGDQSDKETPSIIDKFQNGELDYLFSNWHRDFVYIDDVVDHIVGQVSDWQPGIFDLGACDAIACSEFAKYPQTFGVNPEDVPPIKTHARESYRVANNHMLPPNWKPSKTIRDVMEGRASL